MAAEGSINQSINKAQRHYSSLFFLPSLRTALIAIVVVCLLTGIFSSFVFRPSGGLVAGLLLGGALFATTFFSDVAMSSLVLKDPIFELRRTSVLSLASWLFWFGLIALGIVLSGLFGFSFWVEMCLLGFSLVLTLRAVVLLTILSASTARRLIAVLLQPFACIIPFAFFWVRLDVALATILPFIVISPLIAIGFSCLFLYLINQIGEKSFGAPSIPLFRAFMLNWISAQNEPLEAFLEKLGEDADVEVSMLKFDSEKSKAAIIVPLVHPGPFKNVGSSILPSLLKHAYENEYGGDVYVALGLLGHERNAASQVQNQKIINAIINGAKFAASTDQATPFVRVSEGFVTASCQIFGKTAFLSFTLAPKTTEDLPQELGDIIRGEATRLGLNGSILVNAHNSITSTNEIEASIDTLRDVAFRCLQKAISQHTSPFEVGAATVYPRGFTLKDGMGKGGITALVVRVDEQKTAYITIDGNNMVSGLREKILSELSLAGFSESEVFTTDTHAVSAIIKGHRGYHPIGETMDQNLLIAYIKEVAQTALNRLESCKAGYLGIVVPKVRVMGEGSLAPLTVLIDKGIHTAKRIVAPIFGIEGLLLILLIYFL